MSCSTFSFYEHDLAVGEGAFERLKRQGKLLFLLYRNSLPMFGEKIIGASLILCKTLNYDYAMF